MSESPAVKLQKLCQTEKQKKDINSVHKHEQFKLCGNDQKAMYFLTASEGVVIIYNNFWKNFIRSI